MEIEEEYISGFCRTFNQGRTVTCEYEVRDGKNILVGVDCLYEKCEHKASCLVAQRIRELTECS